MASLMLAPMAMTATGSDDDDFAVVETSSAPRPAMRRMQSKVKIKRSKGKGSLKPESKFSLRPQDEEETREDHEVEPPEDKAQEIVDPAMKKPTAAASGEVRRSFQTLLGLKLGSLACDVFDEYYESVCDFREDRLFQLQAEVLELQQKLGHLDSKKISPIREKGNHVAPPMDHNGHTNDIQQVLAPGEISCKKLPTEIDNADRELPDMYHAFPQALGKLQVPESQTMLKSHSLGQTYPLLQETSDASITPAHASLLSMKVKESQERRFSLQRKQEATSSTAEELDILQLFEGLDPLGFGYVSVEHILETCRGQFGDDDDEIARELSLNRFKITMHKLNRLMGTLGCNPKSRVKKSVDLMNFAAFKLMLLGEPADLEQHLHDRDVQSILQIRELLVTSAVRSKVARACRLKTQVFTAKEKQHLWLEKLLEPMVAIMIVLNSIMIGISLDHRQDWEGWFVFEWIFTLFFVGECATRVWLHGLNQYLFGKEWSWNFFDLALVVFAVIDVVWTLIAKLSDGLQTLDLNRLTVVRFARLVRVTRFVRLARLGIFKEFALMVNGVIAGLRTLFWAMVFLMLIIYSLAIGMRQLSSSVIGSDDCDNTKLDGARVFNVNKQGQLTSESRTCSRGMYFMSVYGETLFKDVARCMLTVFNCFTDACVAPDGTPLTWHLWDAHGGLMIIGYVIAYLFVCFGVFNLVMAVFVETTLAGAEKRRQERQFGNISSHVAHAHELYTLLTKVCRERYDHSGEVNCGTASAWDKVTYTLSRVTSKFSKKATFEPTHLQMRVSQDMFEALLQDASVQAILDALEISAGSREQLFNILDSDGNGYLAISEIVEGMMRLRGPTDKGDIVSAALMVRCVQKQIRRMEAEFLASQERTRGMLISLVGAGPFIPSPKLETVRESASSVN